ncbi:MAG: hypothetical protein K0S65_749 [Labilithrix sp.]|nr:hypothetical protein [Labilithrix sp.]
MNDARKFAPATARNREPILDVLKRRVPAGANVLEIASGTGEHAVFLAPRLAVASWQPSDPDEESRRSIDAWRVHERAEQVLPALDLDVLASTWPEPSARPDIVTCVNMIHISPWRACLALLDHASALLEPGKLLYLYGPYRRDGRHTAPSNEAFDASLRSRNPEWGVRDLEEVVEAAAARGFALVEVVEMPANNLSVLFERRPPS